MILNEFGKRLTQKTVCACCAIAAMFALPNAARSDQSVPKAGAILVFAIDAKRENIDTFAERRAFVEELRTYCQLVGKSFPRNSPNEEEWIDRELESVDHNRVTRVLESSEFGRQQAALFVDNCVGFAGAYRDTENSQLRAKMLIAIAIEFFKRAPDLEYYAATNGINPDQFSFSLCYLVAEKILQLAVLDMDN